MATDEQPAAKRQREAPAESVAEQASVQVCSSGWGQLLALLSPCELLAGGAGHAAQVHGLPQRRPLPYCPDHCLSHSMRNYQAVVRGDCWGGMLPFGVRLHNR